MSGANTTAFNGAEAESFQNGRIRAMNLIPDDLDAPFVAQGVLLGPDVETLEENHPVTKLFTVIDGDATYFLDDEPHRASAGTAVWVRPGVRHRIRNESSGSLHFTVIKWS